MASIFSVITIRFAACFFAGWNSCCEIVRVTGQLMLALLPGLRVLGQFDQPCSLQTLAALRFTVTIHPPAETRVRGHPVYSRNFDARSRSELSRRPAQQNRAHVQTRFRRSSKLVAKRWSSSDFTAGQRGRANPRRRKRRLRDDGTYESAGNPLIGLKSS
jgi:hypothetical protein